MRAIPLKLREELVTLSRMARCARSGEGSCNGGLEWNHAITGLGCKQLQAVWAIQSLCYRHHRGDLKNDEIARLHAYQQITDEDLSKYKLGAQMKQEKRYLSVKFKELL